MDTRSPYMKQRFAAMLSGAKTTDKKKEVKMNSAQWFAFQIEEAEKQGNACECCGDDLDASKIINPRSIIAHLLPKSKFPTVALATTNRAFLCNVCHADFDKMSSEEIEQHPLFGEMKKRIGEFYHLITEVEKASLPDCFRLDKVSSI